MDEILKLLHEAGACSVPLLIIAWLGKGWFEAKVLGPIEELKASIASGKIVAAESADKAHSASFAVLRSQQEAQKIWTASIQNAAKLFQEAITYVSVSRTMADDAQGRVKVLQQATEEHINKVNKIGNALLGRIKHLEEENSRIRSEVLQLKGAIFVKSKKD